MAQLLDELLKTEPSDTCSGGAAATADAAAATVAAGGATASAAEVALPATLGRQAGNLQLLKATVPPAEELEDRVLEVQALSPSAEPSRH